MSHSGSDNAPRHEVPGDNVGAGMEARQASRDAVEAQGRIGPYRLLTPLGEGGMGIVHRAEHVETGDHVALKVVRLSDEVLLESFRREIYALRSVHHPGIVEVIDDGIWEGQPWYAMPLLAGQTLGDLIDELHLTEEDIRVAQAHTVPSSPIDSEAAGRVTESGTRPASSRRQERHAPELGRILSLLAALCEPLAFLHGQGIIHRDLKPDNVLLAGSRPVLVDFGLALWQRQGDRGRETLDVASGGMGTPPYMAPEQIRGRSLDARADLYALGCILYECLTGEPPFVGSPIAILNAHLRDDPVPPSQLVRGVPAVVDEIVARLLAKEPRDRIGYAVDLAELLVDALPDTEHVSVSAGAPAPVPRPYLYRPGLAGRYRLMRKLRPQIGGPDAEGAMFVIGGQSGLGKTRLATELAELAMRGGARVIVGHCQHVGGAQMAEIGAETAVGAPLHAFRPVLRVVADRCRSGGPQETDQLLGEDRAVLATYEPALADLPGAMSPPPDLPPEAARSRLFDALARVLTKLCDRQRVVLVLDDLQWADELSRAFVSRLDESLFRASRLVLVGTYRSDEVDEELRRIIEAPSVVRVELEPLDRPAVSAMVRDMLAIAEPPRALVDFLMRESEGNPFFVAEYLDVAVAEGLLVRRRAAGWTLRAGVDVDGLPVPGGLREVVERRLAALSPEASALVRMAAVLGRDFDAKVLLAAAAVGERERAALEELRSRRLFEEALSLADGQLLEEGHPGDLRFSHDKLREAALAQTPETERPVLHRRAGRALEAQVRGRPDEALHHAALAHHFTVGRDDARALHYLERAGDQALRDGSSAVARGFFERALALEREGRVKVSVEQRARWQRRLGEASYNLGELAAARRHLSAALVGLGARRALPEGPVAEVVASALTLAGQLGRLAGRAAVGEAERPAAREATLAMERLAQVDYFLNRQLAAFFDGLENVRLAERLGPCPELARAYATLEVALGFVPARRLAAHCGRHAQAIAEDVGDPHATAYVALLRGLHALNEGRHRDAGGHLDRAVRVARKSRDLRTEQEALANRGQAHHLAGDYRASRRRYEELLASAKRSQNRQAMAWAWSGLGGADVAEGRPDDAIAAYAQAAAHLPATADVTEELSHGFAGLAYLMKGDLEAARREADRVAVLSAAPPTAWHVQIGYQAAFEVFLALLEERPGDRGLAESARRAERVLRRSCRVLPVGRAISLLLRGRHASVTGQPARAERLWRAAIREATARDLPLELGRALYEWGSRSPPGDPRRAVLLGRAAEVLGRIGAQYWHGRATAAR